MRPKDIKLTPIAPCPRCRSTQGLELKGLGETVCAPCFAICYNNEERIGYHNLWGRALTVLRQGQLKAD